jgi:regulator of replication initiation timing
MESTQARYRIWYMTQKHESEKLVPQLLQNIDPREIADPCARQTIEILLNFIEELNSKVKRLEEENQKLQDEINRLKVEDGKPNIKANKTEGFKKDHSSQKERKTPKEHSKSSKNVNITIDRKEILPYPRVGATVRCRV